MKDCRANLALEVMSKIARQQGDIISSKYFVSLLPKDHDEYFENFAEVQVYNVRLAICESFGDWD